MALLEQSYNGLHFIAASFALSCIALILQQEVLCAGTQGVNVKHHGIVTLHSLALHYMAFAGGNSWTLGVKNIHDVLCSAMHVAVIFSPEDEIHCNQDECNRSRGSKTFMIYRAAQSLLTQCIACILLSAGTLWGQFEGPLHCGFCIAFARRTAGHWGGQKHS